MKKVKRIVSLCIALVLVLTCFNGVTVLAQEEKPTITYNDEVMKGKGLQNVGDGNHSTAYVSEDAPDLSNGKQYLQFDWKDTVKINQVTLYADFCGTTTKAGQAPTEWKILLSTDGAIYTEAATATSEWNDSDGVQSKALDFQAGQGFKSMRVVITKANLNWNHYVVNEIEFKEIKADACTITYNDTAMKGNGLQNIGDGNYSTAYVSEDAPDLSNGKQYFQFDWTNPVKFNQLTLYGDFCGTTTKAGQAPTEWKVLLSTDGTTYSEVATATAEWTDSDDLQSKTVSFDVNTEYKSLRLVITKANLSWNHYSINEIELKEIKEATCTISYNEGVMNGKGLSNICDGDHTTTYVSEDGPDMADGKQYIQFDWNIPVDMNLIGIYSDFCGAGSKAGQAPTKWKVLVSADGNTYEEVANVSANWFENDKLQSKTVKFDAGGSIISLRVVVLEANLDWNHYNINEIQISKVPDNYVIEDLTGETQTPPPVTPPTPTLTVSYNDAKMSGTGLNQLYDGDLTTPYVSEDAPDLSDGKQYFQYDWNTPVEMNLVALYSQFCGAGSKAGQAPTKWRILVSKDGATYKEVSAVSAKWYENDDLQSKTVKFDAGESFVSMRIVIDEANLDWNHYSISEIKVENVDDDYIINDLTGTIPDQGKVDSYVDEEGITQYASCAQISYNDGAMDGKGLGFISDKDKTTVYVSEEKPDLTDGKQYIQYEWNAPIDVNMVTLYSEFCGTKIKAGQAPQQWSILASTDGVNYKKVCDVKKNWRSNDNLQSKVVQFDTQEDIVALRIVIEKANLAWGHYSINEIEISHAPEGYVAKDIRGLAIRSPQTGDSQKIYPLALLCVGAMVTMIACVWRQKEENRGKKDVS